MNPAAVTRSRTSATDSLACSRWRFVKARAAPSRSGCRAHGSRHAFPLPFQGPGACHARAHGPPALRRSLRPRGRAPCSRTPLSISAGEWTTPPLTQGDFT